MATTHINSLAELRTLYGAPTRSSVKKQSPELNATYQQWLARSNFFVIASVGDNGVDCTPRGDKLGTAFRIVDSKTILIPDRRGNNRLDTLSNIISDPRVSLLFFIPHIEQTVRVVGLAGISTDAELLHQFELEEQLPLCCIEVKISAVYFQNSRALSRSEMWQAEHHDISAVPTPEEMLNSVSAASDNQ